VTAAAAVLAALALAACGGGDEQPLADRLDGLGFFRYTPPARRAEFREAIRREGATAVFVVETRRLFPADSEDLAEGGVADELRLLRPALARLQVALPPVSQTYVDDRPYRVRVGDRAWTIHALGSEADSWATSLARTTEILNGLLERAGSNERFYAVGGGNDGWLFLLTPAMRDAIAAALPPDDPERPYRPTA
jgi:hypothetical protein